MNQQGDSKQLNSTNASAFATRFGMNFTIQVGQNSLSITKVAMNDWTAHCDGNGHSIRYLPVQYQWQIPQFKNHSRHKEYELAELPTKDLIIDLEGTQ